MQNRLPTRGFSLVEMIVVMAIIGVLVALLLPAVQMVREAAGRKECANNLRQIGLALHGYHNAFARLPPGVSDQGGTAPYLFMSWHTRLLPYVEQPALWEQALADYARNPDPFRAKPPHADLSILVAVYACPWTPETLRMANYSDTPVAFTAYLGVEGTNLKQPDGVLFQDSAVRLSDVTDGTSNTLAVGERPPSPDNSFGWWYAGVGQFGTGSADMVLGVLEKNFWYQDCPTGPYTYGPGRVGNKCDAFHFWSRHPGGAHFLFVDGSLHFLAYSAASVLPALATRAGGEAVSLPD